MSTKKTFESFVNSMNENVDLYKVYKKVSGKYSLRKPSYWGDLFNQRASIPYRELTKYDKELHSLDVYTTKELGCHSEYPLQSNFKVQVPQVFVLYCNTESGELGEYYGMSILVNTEGATYPRYACGMPDFEPELHNFANGIPESYLNIVTTSAQVLHEQMIVEGQFSWLTSDTNTQIGSERQNMITVFMYDNMGNKWTEKDYDGYGEFGGMDYYDLVATMNGYTEEDVKTMKGSFKALRQLGIDLAFGKIKTKDKKKKTLFPALVEDPRFNWKRHDFTQEAESDPNQSWYQEEESDDDYDDDYENGWYESNTVTEATVVMDAIDPKSKTLKKLLKKYNVKLKVLTMNGPGGGWPEVEMTGSREDLQSILADPNGWDDPELGEYIEESNILEARSINKISKEFGETVNKMKDIVKIYIAAEDGSDEKATTRQQLIDLTKKKKALTNELDDAVAGKNKDVKLVITEGVMSDIHQMIGNHKSFDTFQKEFFKEYGHKKVMKKTPEFLEWLKALYNDFDYAAVEAVETIEEKTYNKKSLMKAMKQDDGMIQLGNGQEYIIYAYDNGNDDNDDMWGDKTIFALDQDGGEHEVKYTDIVSYNESAVNEAAKPKEVKAVEKLIKAKGEEHFDVEGTWLFNHNSYNDDQEETVQFSWDAENGYDVTDEDGRELYVGTDVKAAVKAFKSVVDESAVNEFGPMAGSGNRNYSTNDLVDRIGDLEDILISDRKAEREWEEMSQNYLDGEKGSEYWGDLEDHEIQDAITDAESLMKKYRIKESVVNEGNGQTVKEFGDLLALLLDEDSGMDIERAILAMDPKKARVLEKQISTLYKRLFDLTNQGFDLREDSSAVVESAINEAKRAGLSKKETLKVAQKFADALTKLDGKKYTVSSDYEEDSFDLDVDGEEYAGGSYNINDDGSVVNMATWNRKTNVSPTYGNMDDDIKTIIKTIKNLKESLVAQYKRVMPENEASAFESKIQIKRRYTDNHPAQTSGKTARVRNAMIEALADGVLTEEEFNNILKEKSIDNKRWMKRNSKYFTVSENGIGLSKFGKRILTGIKPVVNLTLESFIAEKANISGAYNDLENLLGTDMETMDDFQRIENDGTWEEMSDFIEMAGDAEVLRRHKFKSQKDIDKLAKYVMGESVVNEAVSKSTKIYQIATPAPQSQLVLDLEELFSVYTGTDYRSIVPDFEEDEGYESVLMFNLSKSDIKKIEDNIADVLIWEYSIKKGKTITESVVNEANYIKFKGKKVDISSLEMEDVDMKDYPDFSDAYFSYGEYSNGKEMTDEELSDFTDDNGDLANELAHDSLH